MICFCLEVNDMHLLAKSISSFLVSKSFITQQEHHIYSYCFEILLSEIIFWSAIFIIAFILGLIYPTIIYLLGFCLFRSIAGGYHASTRFRCFLLSISFYLLFILFFLYLSTSKNICFFFIIFAYLSFFFFAPIDHKNKPFTEELYVNLRHKLFLVMFFFLGVFLILMHYSYTTTLFCLAYGCWQAGVAIIMATYQKRKEVLHNA